MAERRVVNASPAVLLAKAGVIHFLPALERLRRAGAWVSDELIDRAIALAGESSPGRLFSVDHNLAV